MLVTVRVIEDHLCVWLQIPLEPQQLKGSNVKTFVFTPYNRLPAPSGASRHSPIVSNCRMMAFDLFGLTRTRA